MFMFMSCLSAYFLSTNPVFKRKDVLAVIEDDIEYKHDSNQSVECSKCCPGGELSLIGNIHPDGEDQNSGDSIKHGLQDKQGLAFAF